MSLPALSDSLSITLAFAQSITWQTHKGGDMDQEDRQHELRPGELPVEPRMGQAFTY